MGAKLVYRFLRQVSDWVVDNYYEVVVEGAENVPLHGPIIIASTHPNELIDIACLAAKMPHRRHLAFWAKSSMFKSTLGSAIMTSSGAIPVRRNPNSLSSGSGGTNGKEKVDLAAEDEELTARATLFRETTQVLKNDGVTMPGVAWAALEYTRAVQGEEAPGVKIVPVAITYTDKPKYLSRIHICIQELLDEDAEPNAAAKSAAAKLTTELEQRLIAMTGNAADWDTICATKTACQILWLNEVDVTLDQWVAFYQRLAANLDERPDWRPVKAALCKYHALLHYTGIEHNILDSLLTATKHEAATVVAAMATKSLVKHLPLAIARFAAFLPSLLFVFPAYLAGPLAAKLLAKPDEEEGHAQFKAIAGGLGLSVSVSLLFGLLWKLRPGSLLGSLIATGKFKKFVQALLSTYLCTSLMMRWQNLLVKANYSELKRIKTFRKLLLYAITRRALTQNQLEPYTKSLHPAINPYMKSKYLADLPPCPPPPPKISPVKLIGYLLEARRDATAALNSVQHEARAR